MSQLERLAEAIVQVGKQSGPVQQNIARVQQRLAQLAPAVPNDEAGYSRTIRTHLYAAAQALRDVERLLDDFDKQADAFAKRLVGGGASAVGASAGATAAAADSPGVGTATPSGREFLEDTEKNQWLKEQIAKMPVQAGEYTVTLHGNEHQVDINGRAASAAELAELIQEDTNWGGRPVLLLACSTGARSNGLGQQLATLLKVNVRAPTGPASFAGDPPHPIVTHKSVRTPFGTLPMPGRFRTFHPED